MSKVVYNNCYGGFGLSHDAVLLYAGLAGFEISWIEKWSLKHYFKGSADGMSLEEAYKKLKDFSPSNLDRHDPILVEVVETLGKDANGQCADLRIYELSGNKYRIDEYDGNESVHENYDDSWTYIP